MNGLTLQEFASYLQLQIDKGAIDGSLPAAICFREDAKSDYRLLAEETTSVVQFDDTAIIRY